MIRRPQYPRLIGTLVALVVLSALSARLAHAQAATRHVPVATRALARGTVLSADDFVMRDTTLRGVADTNHVEAGWVTRRLINAGEVLRTPAVERPAIVSPNQPVQIEWQDRNVRLVLQGVATQRGGLGERVSVRSDTGRRMEATVVAPGRVRIY